MLDLQLFVASDTSGQQIEVSRGTTFISGPGFLGFDMAEWLDDNCANYIVP